MLSSVSRFPPTPAFEDERTAAALVLITYLRRSHRTDLYSKYVAFLADLHRSEGNKAEGAFAFLRHADILSWTAEPLAAVRTPLSDVFPAQTAASRLECVLVAGVERLAAAECWEEAVALCGILSQRFTQTGEFSKLAAVSQRRATLVDRIAHVERVHPAYFAVFYRGASFPADVRGRCFVCRGARGERMDAFKQRLVAKWPGATFAGLDLSPFVAASEPRARVGGGTGDSGGEESMGLVAQAASDAAALPSGGAAATASGDFSLSLASVNPVAAIPPHPLDDAAAVSAGLDDDDAAAASAAAAAAQGGAQSPALASPAAAAEAGSGLQSLLYDLVARPGDTAPPSSSSAAAAAAALETPARRPPPLSSVIRLGSVHAGVRAFAYTRTFRRRAAKTSQSFLDLWLSVAHVRVAEAFPCARRRVPVVEATEAVLNPLEAAVLALREKNIALRDATERAMAGPDGAAPQSFTAALQGVVDPVISGGLANYKPFFDGSFRASHPEIAEDLDAGDRRKAWVESALRDAVAEQLRVAARAVRVHGRKCAPAMIPLHDFLVGRFGDLVRQAAGLGTPGAAGALALPV